MTSSIFLDGKLKPGIYMIQNLQSETYLDLHLRSMELCCRPRRDLERRRGLWEIKNLGEGYGVWRFYADKPHQSCSLVQGFNDAHPVCVTTYPSGWRIARVDDKSEYVRFHFGPTNRMLNLSGGSRENGAPVIFWSLLTSDPYQNYQKWKLIPVKVKPGVGVTLQSLDETFDLDLPPDDESEPEQSSVHD